MKNTRKGPNPINQKRKLVIVDIENLCERPDVDEPAAKSMKDRLVEILKIGELDLVIIGVTHPKNWLNARYGWPWARCEFQPGSSGAEIALIKTMRSMGERLLTFQEIVIASGDGIFSGIAQDLSDLGIHVTVVSSPKPLSTRLSFSCEKVLDIGSAAEPTTTF